MKRLLLLAAGVVAILAGVVSFAAFESHIINIRAHVESATYTTPDEINLGTVFPQEVIHLWCADGTECTGDGCPPPPPPDNCAKIWLSHSFLEQDRVVDVRYEVWCEWKDLCRDGEECTGPVFQPITPYMLLHDSDPDFWWGDLDHVIQPNCYPLDLWAVGSLHKDLDPVDWWDLAFFAPVCAENYNPLTDPGPPPPDPIPPIVEGCNKGPDPDSYRWIDLGSDLKFQVTGFSYPCVCPAGAADCVCE
jgi:hypothetical protein